MAIGLENSSHGYDQLQLIPWVRSVSLHWIQLHNCLSDYILRGHCIFFFTLDTPRTGIKKVVITPTLSSVTAPEAVISTTCTVISDHKNVTMTTLDFQCTCEICFISLQLLRAVSSGSLFKFSSLVCVIASLWGNYYILKHIRKSIQIVTCVLCRSCLNNG